VETKVAINIQQVSTISKNTKKEMNELNNLKAKNVLTFSPYATIYLITSIFSPYP